MTQVPPAPPTVSLLTKPKGSSTTATCMDGTGGLHAQAGPSVAWWPVRSGGGGGGTPPPRPPAPATATSPTPCRGAAGHLSRPQASNRNAGWWGCGWRCWEAPPVITRAIELPLPRPLRTLAPYTPALTLEARTPPEPAPIVTKSYSRSLSPISFRWLWAAGAARWPTGEPVQSLAYERWRAG